MNEVSSLVFFFLKKIQIYFNDLKKNDFDLSKYHICFVVLKKKKDVVFGDKNSNLFCYMFYKE